MPIDKDLKDAYTALYEERDALQALKKYDAILKEHPECLHALVYKAASLEKLYYGFSDWHNDHSLENAHELLDNALSISQKRGDRSKIGFVYFRFFIHHYNNKDYEAANENLGRCKEYGFEDPTLLIWQTQLNKKLRKISRKKSDSRSAAQNDSNVQPEPDSILSDDKLIANQAAIKVPASQLTQKASVEMPQKFRTEWYQTTGFVTLSLFTNKLPHSEEEVTLKVSTKDKKSCEVSYSISETDSEFQYSITLAHEVNTKESKVKVFTKKIELIFEKNEKIQWKQLESKGLEEIEKRPSKAQAINASIDTNSLKYPSSSRKHIDWSKIELEEEDDENSGSADAFFQKIYANADSDTQRAMMKSFVESNGTSLNTNWDDVSKKFVEPAPPEGTDLKHW